MSADDLIAHARDARAQGRFESALADYQAAADIARAQGELPELAHRVRHVGDLALELGQTGLAARAIEEAIALYQQVPNADPLDLANCTRAEALLRQAEGRPSESRQAWQRAHALYAQAGVTAGVAECAEHLAGHA
jgi:tetratricopeptide (TPR) repeat protein